MDIAKLVVITLVGLLGLVTTCALVIAYCDEILSYFDGE